MEQNDFEKTLRDIRTLMEIAVSLEFGENKTLSFGNGNQYLLLRIK